VLLSCARCTRNSPRRPFLSSPSLGLFVLAETDARLHGLSVEPEARVRGLTSISAVSELLRVCCAQLVALGRIVLTHLSLLLCLSVRRAAAQNLHGRRALAEKVYTLDADFAEGLLVNVNYVDVPNQLQLDSEATPFDFIWVAASARGTIVKVDTITGDILGEYRSTPSSHGSGNPSRTTVDNDGSVWVANRNNVAGGKGTIVHIGLEENGQCEDRNGNGVIGK